MRTNIFQDASLVDEYRRLCAKAQSGEISEEEKARLDKVRQLLDRGADEEECAAAQSDPEALTPREKIIRAANDIERAAAEQALGKKPPPPGGRER